MSTYLPGVQDFIPQIQPYQPDLNFLSNLLQTKQTQYDSNWKSLNKMYSQYYNADLTREDNIKTKDAFMKQTEFNLQRISQMDLSLEQNASQATQIFKPFYENNFLMKDMAFTKNKERQKNIGLSLKGSFKREDRDMYWNEGIQEIDYKVEEFKNASAEESLSFQNPEYTRHVNVNKEARKIAKESGLSMTTPSFSPDGRYIITTKNGEQLIEPLSKLFESELGSDPSVQAVYKTLAYLDRKNYAYSNAAQFKGGEKEAEMKYLENQFTDLKEQNLRRYESLKSNSITYDSRIKDLKNQIDNGKGTPKMAQELKNYELNKSINDKVLERINVEKENLNEDNSNASGSFSNPYGDVKSLIWKVDSAVASNRMQKALNESAETLAYIDYKVDVKADPYKVKEIDHSYRMSEIASRNQGLINAANVRNKGEAKNARNKYLVENGLADFNEDGDIIMNESLNTVTDTNYSNVNTDEKNRKEVSISASKMHTRDLALPYLNNMINMLNVLETGNKIDNEQLKKIINYKKAGEKGIEWERFKKLIQKDPDNFLRKHVGSKGLKKITENFNAYIKQNSNLSVFKPESRDYQDLAVQSNQLQDYYLFTESDRQWRINTAKVVSQKIGGNAKYLYDKNGNIRSEAEFKNELKKHGVKENKPISIPDESSLFAKNHSYIYKYLKTAIKNTGNDWISDYDKLHDEAAKQYTYSNLSIKAPPVIVGPAGSGLSTMNKVKSIIVNTKGMSGGKAHYMDISRDLDKINFGDNLKYHVSLEGVGEDAYASIKAGRNRLDIGDKLLKAIKLEMSNPKNKFGNFEVLTLPITSGKSNQGAYIIRPPDAWVKANTSTITNGKVTKPGLFNAAQAESIMKNGVAYMMPSNEMNSSIYKSYFNDPIATYLNTGDNKVYKRADEKDPRFNIEISPNETSSPGTFNMTIHYIALIDGKETEQSFSQSALLGNNLMIARDKMLYDLFPQFQQNIKSEYNNGK